MKDFPNLILSNKIIQKKKEIILTHLLNKKNIPKNIHITITLLKIPKIIHLNAEIIILLITPIIILITIKITTIKKALVTPTLKNKKNLKIINLKNLIKNTIKNNPPQAPFPRDDPVYQVIPKIKKIYNKKRKK
jgi:hypothetical protein